MPTLVLDFQERFQVEQSTACGCQLSAVGCLIDHKNFKSKKGHNSKKKNAF